MKETLAESAAGHNRYGHSVSFREALLVWLRVAVLSFGGPAGQIAVMHRILVDEKKWISESRFLHALNYCMLLPGPEAQQLATYIGWLLHRTAGGLVAGTLFVLPGFVSILILSILYAGFKDLIDEGVGAIIQGVGYPNPNRSHFTSMDIWHTARDGAKGYGWIGRYFDNTCRWPRLRRQRAVERQSHRPCRHRRRHARHPRLQREARGRCAHQPQPALDRRRADAGEEAMKNCRPRPGSDGRRA